jgi:hypothetical protein
MGPIANVNRIEIWRERCAIVLFFIVLWLPFADSLLTIDPSEDLTENRVRETKPELGSRFSLRELETYPGKYETYYNDSFGFRNSLVQANSYLYLKLFGASSTSKVHVGKEGWLYLAETVDYFILGPAASRGALQTWTRTLEERYEWLQDRGIEYLFIVLPIKSTLYPEFLPEKAVCKGQGNLLDQLVEWLDRNSEVPVLDVRGGVLAAKERDRLYHRTDTHWNDVGAFVAYTQIVERLSSVFPELRPWPESDFKRVVLDREGGDLARMLNLSTVLPEESIELDPQRTRRAEYTYTLEGAEIASERTTVEDARLPRCLVFRDSFFNTLALFLAEHFERMDFYPQSYEFFPELVHAAAPDIVLQPMAERLILLGLENPAEVRESFGPRRRFFSSNRTVWSTGGETGFGALELDESPAVVDASGNLTIRFSEARPSFAFDVESLGKPLPRILRIDLSSREADRVTLRVQPSRNPNWGEDILLDLKPGRNIFYRVLPKFGGRGSISFRPGPMGKEISLNSLEIRYVRIG